MDLHNLLQNNGHTMDWQDTVVGLPDRQTWTSVLIRKSYFSALARSGAQVDTTAPALPMDGSCHTVDGRELTRGRGPSKKASRELAAIHALEYVQRVGLASLVQAGRTPSF
jgi:hypothetical protein